MGGGGGKVGGDGVKTPICIFFLKLTSPHHQRYNQKYGGGEETKSREIRMKSPACLWVFRKKTHGSLTCRTKKEPEELTSRTLKGKKQFNTRKTLNSYCYIERGSIGVKEISKTEEFGSMLEEFIPVKKKRDEDEDEGVDLIRKENGDKKNWLNSTQLWNIDETVQA
ncbi:hypothetical protein Tco_0642831 [Tanacetum coccineum]